MGITTRLYPYPSIVLGGQDVTPLEMADAYATLASGGIHHKPQAIEKVVFPSGRVEKSKAKGQARALGGRGLRGAEDPPAEHPRRHRRRHAGVLLGHLGRQDGHHQRLHRRLVLRLQHEARDGGLDGLPRPDHAHVRSAGRDLLRAHLRQVLQPGLRRPGAARLPDSGRDAGLEAVEGPLLDDHALARELPRRRRARAARARRRPPSPRRSSPRRRRPRRRSLPRRSRRRLRRSRSPRPRRSGRGSPGSGVDRPFSALRRRPPMPSSATIGRHLGAR